LKKSFDLAARIFGLAAAAFLIVMMMVTVVDVSLRSLFNIPVFGTFDIVELMMVATIFLAVPATYLREEHIVIDVIDHVAPKRLVDVLRWTGTVLTLIYLVVMASQMIQPALDKIDFGDVTLDLGIPKYIHWIPILLGTFFSAVAVAAILWRDVRAARKRDR
jgi:TRAP-type C4-dicarboxylate transport system permease small subunit